MSDNDLDLFLHAEKNQKKNMSDNLDAFCFLKMVC